MRGIAKALPDNGVTITDFTPDWERIIFYMDGEQSSGDYLLYQDGGLSLLASARSSIPPEAVHSVHIYEYKARDDYVIPSLLTLPNGVEATRLPAIVFPHGGPEAYDQKGFNYKAQYFASRGYAVIQPQFRGSTGFGPEHQFQGRGEWGRKMQDDLTDSVSDLVAKGIIDPDRVCIVGASYGGYAALAGAVFTPDIYKCAVSINGVSDIAQMVRSDRRDYGSNHWVVSYWENVIANGTYDNDHLDAISPINHVENVTIPVLLIHGEHDSVIDIRQSKQMAEELQDAGKQVTLIELEKGDHYLSNAQNRQRAMLAIDAFLNEHLQ